jgi:hypothetical protein
MYVRQAKQFLRSAIEGFDERKYGFQSIVDLLRAAGKDGVLRIERDRQGAVRVFPGHNLQRSPSTSSPVTGEPIADEDVQPIDTTAAQLGLTSGIAEVVSDPPIAEGQTIDDEIIDEPQPDVEPDGTPTRKAKGARKTSTARASKTVKAKTVKTTRARKAPSRTKAQRSE